YSQAEIKEYIDQTLNADSIPVSPGIFFVFSDEDFEQSFLQNKQRSQSNFLRLVNRPEPKQYSKLRFSIREERKKELFELSVKTIAPLRIQWLELGRQPDKSEAEDLVSITEVFGTYNKAIKFLTANIEPELLEQARNNRIDDILTYLAFQTFTKRTAFIHMDNTLKRDIKVFFSDYSRATTIATELIYSLGDTSKIESACIKSSEEGLGYYDDEDKSFHFPAELLNRLSAILRLYVDCASILYGDVETADLVKIHVESGKVSLMVFDDFIESPLPLLQERIKINFRLQEFDIFEYGEQYKPTYLYLKSRYINEEFPNYADQLAFDEKLQSLTLADEVPLFNFLNYGPPPGVFRHKLNNERLEIKGFELINSQSIPLLDDSCGNNYTFRDFIECGETWQAQHEHDGIENTPKQAETYNALHKLAKDILDPVIDYFGMIRLTYGFSSAKLSKVIQGRIAPKLDQHASYELNRMKNPICSRFGAACDFIVADEDMLEVAQWVVENTHFDRLYFYGKDKPIHVSIAPEHKGEIVVMKQGKLRLIPLVIKKDKFLSLCNVVVN
ncbi:MAG: DNA phosphorothioation-associated putative methyltransferase, partial [Pseudomonadota bacterium]